MEKLCENEWNETEKWKTARVKKGSKERSKVKTNEAKENNKLKSSGRRYV